MADTHHYSCGSHEAKEPYHYRQCGLDNVYLHDGFELEVIDGQEYVSVANVDGLWKAIGLSIATEKKELSPKEIRFLRSHMGLTQEELAKKLGVDGQTLARWEKQKCAVPGPADLAIRTLFLTSPVAAPEGGEIIYTLYKLIEEREEETKPDFSAIHLIKTMDGWAIDTDYDQLRLTNV